MEGSIAHIVGNILLDVTR